MIEKIVIRDNKKSPVRYLPEIPLFKNGKVFEFKPGVNVIVGKNGCGKTTLMKKAYMQGIQDGMAYTEESFRREAAKDILAGMMSNPEKISLRGERLATIDGFVNAAIEITDELIAKLKEK